MWCAETPGRWSAVSRTRLFGVGLCALLLCGCPVITESMVSDRLGDAVGTEGRFAGECSDAADNDGDGLYDCDDPDCAASPDCQVVDTNTHTGPETGAETGDETGHDTATVVSPVGGLAFCAAGGIASKGDITVVSCTAPLDMTTRTATRWQPGPITFLASRGGP